jgi:thiol:disulfide interchange protein
MYMKTKMRKIGTALLVGLCIWSTEAFAQTTTTVTTTKGAFTEYVPASETVMVRSETNPAPLRYVVTKQTTVVDETGAPVAIQRISAGSPISIEYTGSGDRLVASRIVVQKAVAANAPVTTAPVTTQETTTATTATRPLTHHEKHELKEAEEHRRHETKEQLEHEKKAVEKTQDKLDDEH